MFLVENIKLHSFLSINKVIEETNWKTLASDFIFFNVVSVIRILNIADLFLLDMKSMYYPFVEFFFHVY